MKLALLMSIAAGLIVTMPVLYYLDSFTTKQALLVIGAAMVINFLYGIILSKLMK